MGQTRAARRATRDRILEVLLADPGLHLRAAPRAAGVSLRAARYHLDALVEEGRVVRQRAGGYVRYFPSGVYNAQERALIGAVRVGHQRRVIEVLVDAGPQPFGHLLSRTHLARSSLASALRRLTRERIVGRADQGPWALRDPAACRMALTLVKPRFGDRLADSADDLFRSGR